MARSGFYFFMQQRSNKPSLSLGERHATAGEGIRRLLITLFTVLLAACGQSESTAQITSIDTPSTKIVKASDIHLNCHGVFEQGGTVICKTFPFAIIVAGDVSTKADGHGLVVLGFDRDAPKAIIIKSKAQGYIKEKTFSIAPREYTISRIDGLPPSQVSNYSKEQLARIRSSSARKKKGFASREQTMWFKDGFTYPLKSFVKTSPFGAQRILNGIKKKPHYGVDIAAPVGTPIYAPADGVVSLADDDLYFEGAMVLLDHGQGLISMYLHMDAIDVKPGQMVKRGEKLGEVGSKGRSTGPHLCWRLKWRNRHLDPELLTEWPND